MHTHNLCFGSKIWKINIPLHTPVLLYKSGVKGGIHCADLFFSCNVACFCSLATFTSIVSANNFYIPIQLSACMLQQYLLSYLQCMYVQPKCYLSQSDARHFVKNVFCGKFCNFKNIHRKILNFIL